MVLLLHGLSPWPDLQIKYCVFCAWLKTFQPHLKEKIRRKKTTVTQCMTHNYYDAEGELSDGDL